MEFEFKAKLWEWQGEGAWYFLSLPREYYDAIHEIGFSTKRGFGSLRVEATIGRTNWKTSIFPDSKSKTYLLPVKKEVRKNEDLNVDDIPSVRVRLLEV